MKQEGYQYMQNSFILLNIKYTGWGVELSSMITNGLHRKHPWWWGPRGQGGGDAGMGGVWLQFSFFYPTWNNCELSSRAVVAKYVEYHPNERGVQQQAMALATVFCFLSLLATILFEPFMKAGDFPLERSYCVFFSSHTQIWHCTLNR